MGRLRPDVTAATRPTSDTAGVAAGAPLRRDSNAVVVAARPPRLRIPASFHFRSSHFVLTMGGFELIPTAPCVGSARIKALLDTHTTQSLNANWPAQTPQPRQPVGRSPPRAVQRRPQAPSGGPSSAGGSPAQGRAQATQSYDTITTLTVQYQP